MKHRKPFENLLETEMFGEGNRFYFVDLKMACNATTFLSITRSDRLVDEAGKVSYRRETVRVFEEELFQLIEAMSMVLGATMRDSTKLSGSVYRNNPGERAQNYNTRR
jgi:Protein of unknown function (DUF3276)